MGFLNRSLRLGLFSVMLVAMTAIPSTWNLQAPGTALGPTPSWAGGTPDESLHPQPTPTTPKRTISAPSLGHAGSTIVTDRSTTTGAQGTLRDRLIAVWTFVRAMSLRN